MIVDAEELRFREAVPASMKAVNAFADYLRRKGLETVVNDAKARPDPSLRAQYGDAEDIKARYPDGPWRRFEVKGRTLLFTCRDDFPFDTLIADRASKTTARADWYINVSKDLQYAAVMDGAQREQWQVSSIHDGTKGYGGMVYLCPKQLARFIRIAL